MFTGIIESTGTVQNIVKEGTNVHFTVASAISYELKIDQSLAHDGTCLTVVALGEGNHTVTAIEETLLRTNLGSWKVGDLINLERAMSSNARFDGHIVQGHVDATGEVMEVNERDGSWYYRFRFPGAQQKLLVDKGSVTINGVSLTVVNPGADRFMVAIIPYTHENTNFGQLQPGDMVNLEFDIIGKYLLKMAKPYLR